MMTHHRLITLFTAAASLAGAINLNAAWPLIVDDADILEAGESELVVSWDYVRDRGAHGHAVPVELAHGLAPGWEATIGTGYQFLRERHAAPGEPRHRADGWLDTIAALKWVPPVGLPEFSFTVEGSIKLPTASASRGLGTGSTDFGLNLAATRAVGNTALDLNAGYLFSEHLRGRRRDGDEFFYGAALRHAAGQGVELFVEAFGETPVGDRRSTILTTRIGGTWVVQEGTALGVGIGTSFGTDSPRFLATAGVVQTF